MFKVEIDVGDWSWEENEKLIIETNDFAKAQIIVEFVEFQQEFGWAADYQLSDEFIDNQCDEEGVEFGEDEIFEDEEYAEYEIGDIVEDEDGLIWKRVA